MRFLLAATISGFLFACASAPDAIVSEAQIHGAWVVLEADGLRSQQPPGLQFLANNVLAGGASCNAFSGEYHLNGRTLLFSNVETTLLGCRQAPDVARQHSAFGAMLDSTFHVRSFTGSNMALVTLDGHRLTLARQNP